MYAACSTTARRGALDWAPIFEKANLPIFEKLYQSVRDGTETRKSLEFNGRKTYREDLTRELAEIDSQEIWRAGLSLCSLVLALGWFVDVPGFNRKGCPFSAPRLQRRVSDFADRIVAWPMEESKAALCLQYLVCRINTCGYLYPLFLQLGSCYEFL